MTTSGRPRWAHFHRARVNGADCRPSHVVLADDDDAMRDLLQSALGNHGYDVTDVASGDELKALLDAAFAGQVPDGIDLIVTDNRMPACTGLDVLAALRARDWATPVILITAFGDTATHDEAHRPGATGSDRAPGPAIGARCGRRAGCVARNRPSIGETNVCVERVSSHRHAV